MCYFDCGELEHCSRECFKHDLILQTLSTSATPQARVAGAFRIYGELGHRLNKCPRNRTMVIYVQLGPFYKFMSDPVRGGA